MSSDVDDEIGCGGKVCVYSSAATDLVVDVTSFVKGAASMQALAPARVFESRLGEKSVDGKQVGGGRVAAGSVTQVDVAGRAGGTVTEFTINGRAGVPAVASAVFLNVAAVSPNGPGYLTVFPCGIDPPLAANVNYNGGDVAANAVLTKVGVGGKVCVFSLAGTDLVVDVKGYVSN